MALCLTGCGGASRPAPLSPNSASAPAPPVPAGLESFYAQEVSWYPCAKTTGIVESQGGAFECATVEVPLDYDDPAGQTISIAVKKRQADDDSIGALFINPGGPGGSGVDLVDNVKGYFSDDLTASYDIIGFDPRGVGYSTAVDCLTDAERDASRAGDSDQAADRDERSEEEAQAAVTEAAQEWEDNCEANTLTAGLLDHIDTISAARDLDVLRAVMGQNSLSYLGFSYGTYLGATYAELFPANVGRMVLDGALDPSLTAGEVSRGQAEGFEAALRAYIQQCQDGGMCPLTGDVDSGVNQVQQFLERAATSPVPTSDPARPLTRKLAQSAILSALYTSEVWPALTAALAQAMLLNDGSALLAMGDLLVSRRDDGSYAGNTGEVIVAINCLDYPVTGDSASWAQEADEIEAASPTFGKDLGYSDLFCQSWGHPSQRSREPIHAAGAAPILVVGTTGDPATRYAWSQALAEQLDSGQLVTWQGEGHTAYGRAGECLTSAVDQYLLTGDLPEEGLTYSG